MGYRNPAIAPERIALVRASWTAAAAQADELTKRFYDNLFEIDPGAASLFHGVDMAAQRTKLAQSLAVVVNALDDLERLILPLTALGKRHAGYRVEYRHFESVGKALVQAFGAVLKDDFSTDVRAAWIDAYGVVAGVMQRALKSESGGQRVAMG